MKKLNLGMGTEIFHYTSDSIDENVAPFFPGNYALGELEGTSFIPLYVGRSDTNLNVELKQYLSGEKKKNFPYFKFTFNDAPFETYKMECKNYHDFLSDDLTNKNHPARPFGEDEKSLPCPFKGCEANESQD